MRVSRSNDMPKIMAEANINWSDEWTDEEIQEFRGELSEDTSLEDELSTRLTKPFEKQIPDEELDSIEVTVSVTE